MSHPVLEITAGVVFAVALALGAMFILPRPKPPPPPEEPPPVESVQVPVTKTTVRAEPLPEKTTVQRVEKIEDDVNKIFIEQRALIDEIKAATKAEKGK